MWWPRPHQHCLAADEPSAALLEPLHRDGVVPVVSGVGPDPPGHRGIVGVHLRLAGELVNPPGLGERLGRPDHHLAGNATPVRAFPTDQLPLHPQHGQPGVD